MNKSIGKNLAIAICVLSVVGAAFTLVSGGIWSYVACFFDSAYIACEVIIAAACACLAVLGGVFAIYKKKYTPVLCICAFALQLALLLFNFFTVGALTFWFDGLYFSGSIFQLFAVLTLAVSAGLAGDLKRFFAFLGAIISTACAAVWILIAFAAPVTYLVCVIIISLACIVAALLGGIFAYSDKKLGVLFCFFALMLQIISILCNIMMFGGLGAWQDPYSCLGNFLQLIATLVLVLALVYSPKQKRFYACMSGPFFGTVGGVFFTLIFIWASLLSPLNGLPPENTELFIAGSVIAGIGGGTISLVGGLRALYGKDGFGLTLGALLMMCVQFLLACTMLRGIHFVLLGIGGALFALIGGVLIGSGSENGFLIVAFGIIFMLVWLVLLAFISFIAMIAALAVMAAIILLMAEAISAYRRANGLGNGKVLK